MKLLNLSLTLDEINMALEALGQMPYVKVSGLINKIQQQSIAQLQQDERLHEVAGQEQSQQNSGDEVVNQKKSKASA